MDEYVNENKTIIKCAYRKCLLYLWKLSLASDMVPAKIPVYLP